MLVLVCGDSACYIERYQVCTRCETSSDAGDKYLYYATAEDVPGTRDIIFARNVMRTIKHKPPYDIVLVLVIYAHIYYRQAARKEYGCYVYKVYRCWGRERASSFHERRDRSRRQPATQHEQIPSKCEADREKRTDKLSYSYDMITVYQPGTWYVS